MKTLRKNKFVAFVGAVSIVFASRMIAAPNIGSLRDYLGPQFKATEPTASSTPTAATVATSAADTLARWNQIAIDASGLDHTPVAANDPRIFGEQLGPARASRAIAIGHIA